MITTLSRYEYNRSADIDGITTAVRKPVNNLYVQKYTVKSGDTVENIAAKVYGDPTQFWRIADINPQIKFPMDLAPGMVIRIPQ